jgi:hypothetical protein
MKKSSRFYGFFVEGVYIQRRCFLFVFFVFCLGDYHISRARADPAFGAIRSRTRTSEAMCYGSSWPRIQPTTAAPASPTAARLRRLPCTSWVPRAPLNCWMPGYTPHSTTSLQWRAERPLRGAPTGTCVNGFRRSAVNNEAGPSRAPSGAVLLPPPLQYWFFPLFTLFLLLAFPFGAFHWND